MFIEKLKMRLLDEFEEYSEQHETTPESLHIMKEFASAIEKLCDIAEAMDDGEYSERRGYSRRAGGSNREGRSYRDGSSYRQRRDDMGRYSGEGGSRNRGYSRTDAKSAIMEQIEDLMDESSDREKQILQKAMRSLSEA